MENPSTLPSTRVQGQTDTVLSENRKQVYLAWVPQDSIEKRSTLAVMLEKAGMEVLPKEDCPSDEEVFKRLVDMYMAQAEFSVHVLGGEYGTTLGSSNNASLTKYQYDQAVAKSRSSQGEFKRFVWSYPLEGMILQGEQADLVTQIQNSLSPEVMFTTVANPAQLIDDLRNFLQKETVVKAVPKEYDLAFISNVQDAGECYLTIEELGKSLKVSTLTVVPENDMDYRTQASELVRKSRLAVVYFKEASDWSVSFVKQVWKHVGGASFNTPFLLIGEDEPRRNRFIRFKAPQILLQVVKKEEVLPTLLKIFESFKKTGSLTDERFSPYTGLRPFNEDESIFFKGREKHIDYIIEMCQRQKFAMVTGSSGDGKSSLIYAGVIPNLKGGFLKTQYTKWAVADFRPERQPLRNMSIALASELRLRNVDDVENALSYGFSALVDLYKKSPIYCDITSAEYQDADEEERKGMKRRAANLLILVDQFEELFTNVENYRDGVASPIAQISVNVLVETIRIAREENLPIYVVCTMRSDYIGQCVAFRGFAEMIGLSTYYVPRLKREEVQEVIQAPAQLNGNRISLRLTQRLLNDLGDGIDQLPVLQHSLHQIWTDAKRGDDEMDLIHYARVGGLTATKLPREYQSEYERWFATIGEARQALFDKPRLRNVLNRHANELFETAVEYYNTRYSPAIEKEQAQHIIRVAFTCLTKIDENRAVRNRMTLQQITEIIGDEKLDYQVVGRVMNIFREQGNTFVQPFISDDPDSKELMPSQTLDITHESLIRNWERLVDWAEAEHKSVQVYSDFKVQVNRWLANDSDPKYLLGVGPYNFFNEWYKTQRPNAAWIRRYFRPDELVAELDPMEQATLYLEDIEDFLAESRKKIDRNKLIRNIVSGVILALLLVASLLAIYGFNQAAEARDQAEIANLERAKALKEKEAADIARKEAEKQKELAEIQRIKAEQAAIEAEAQRAIAEGKKLEAERAKQYADNQKRLAELAAKRALESEAEALKQKTLADSARAEAEVNAEAALREGKNAGIQKNNALILQSLFLASLAEQQADLKKPDVGILLALEALPKKIGDKDDRPYVEEAEAALYYAVDKIVNAQPKAIMEGHTNKMIYTQFSPDSKRLISTSWDRTARIWDVESGKQIGVLSGHTHIVDKAYFSNDGNYTITMAEDFTARLWDVRTAKVVTTLRGHKDLLTHAAISNDARYVVTTSMDKTAILYDAQTGTVLATLPHEADVLHANFSPDGKLLVTSSADRTAKLWNGTTGSGIATLAGHADVVRFATFSLDNAYIVTASDDYTGRVWDGRTGQPLRVLRGHLNKVNFAAFSYDHGKVATTSADSTARVWDIKTGNEIGRLSGQKGHKDNVYNVQWSSDGRFLLTTSDDRTVRLWDAQSYLRVAVYEGTPGLGYYAVFSPDAKYIATAGKLGQLPNEVRIFQTLPTRQDLIEFAKSRKLRELSENEKQLYFITDKRIKEVIKESLQERENRMKRLQNKPVIERPSQQPASQQPGNPNREARLHRVKNGETLWQLGRQYGASLEDLRRWNALRKDEDIAIGDVLVVRAS